ncbi:MAG TPA: hypothetical protein VK760_06115, partial [Candidatus Acidoferrales bacterium]|nr:hypothetical protein [Candidatus Acidoferrales bacterium]
DYYGNAVRYVAPKTGKLLFQLSGKTAKLSYPAAVAVDRHHNTYVLGHFDNASNREVFEILVFDANAPLTKHPKPSRVIVGSHTRLAYGNLAVDAAGRIYVTVQNPANAILVFAKGANGNVAPKATIAGSLTQLAGTEGIAIAPDGTIHVATIGKVLTFAKTASGNVAPVATLNAGASSATLTGLAYDASGNLLVADDDRAVYAYVAAASGSDAPLWTLHGPRTKMLQTYSAVADKDGYLYVSFEAANTGEVGIYKPGGGNLRPIAHLAFSFPSDQIAAMP